MRSVTYDGEIGIVAKCGPGGEEERIKTCEVRQCLNHEPGDLSVSFSTMEAGPFMVGREDRRAYPLTVYLESSDADWLAREILRRLGKPLEEVEDKLARAEDKLATVEEKLVRIGRVLDS